MADDIVTRLRCNPCDCDGTCWTCQAADEIERLEFERDEHRDAARAYKAEIERLRAEVKDLRNTHRAIRALTWEITRQNPSHLKAWIDIRMMVVNDEEARRGCAEDIAIAERIRERAANDSGSRTPLNEVAADFGIDLDSL